MIHRLVIVLLCTVFSAEYLVRERHLLHPYFVLLPEVLSAVAMVIVLARITAGAKFTLDWRYVAFITVLVVTLAFGFLTQDVPTGAMVAGMRAHLKFIPFFLLPAVYRFTPDQLKAQLKTLLVILLLQTPLAVYQRFVEYADSMHTGDPVRGTASTSSALSMLLVCAVGGVVALYLRRKIPLRTFVVLTGILLLPTMINETKATLLLLPVAFLVPAFYMPRGSHAFQRVLPIVGVGALAAVAFVGVYNTMIQYRSNGQSIGQFFGGAAYEHYLYTGGEESTARNIGRFDSIEIAAARLSEEPLSFAIGKGAGNTSTSFLSAFDGKYAFYFDRFGIGMTQVTTFLWEIGVVGLIAYLFFYWFVWRDASVLARSLEPTALLGQIWVTVTITMGFALIYKSIFSMNEIGYLFWYFSGVVASEAVLLRRERRSRLPALRSAASEPLERNGAVWL